MAPGTIGHVVSTVSAQISEDMLTTHIKDRGRISELVKTWPLRSSPKGRYFVSRDAILQTAMCRDQSDTDQQARTNTVTFP
jgi:hypothetical protein